MVCLVDIVSRYTQTFLWLQQYDEGLLAEPKVQTGGTLPTYTEAKQALQSLKIQLMERGEASGLFGRERDDGLSAILGNLDQTVFGEPAYPSIEKSKPRICSISWSKTTRFQTAINAAVLSCLWISYTATVDYSMMTVFPSLMTQGLLHSLCLLQNLIQNKKEP
ncbi:hypothetical protein SAMN02910354_01943 [Basfia succiniciproducens]|uniref:Uncharacterized protein n=1 Tax=Basfia succiniciproducens TaxID=653940 RepID=A0A1G5E8L1_9PAST|nr:hypothetical protein SAMN02910354_01943 [Basfia succiniciproducens]